MTAGWKKKMTRTSRHTLATPYIFPAFWKTLMTSRRRCCEVKGGVRYPAALAGLAAVVSASRGSSIGSYRKETKYSLPEFSILSLARRKISSLLLF